MLKGDNMINQYTPYLTNELGMADTRARDLTDAMNDLHKSIAKMDQHNLRIMWTIFTGLMESVAVFADKNPGLNDFREWKPK